MKKFTTHLLVVTVLALTCFLTGCGSADIFDSKTFVDNESKIEKVVIDVHDREVTISESNDNGIHIDYFESEKEFYEISLSEENVLTMKLLQNKEWTDFIGTKPAEEFRKINLKLPNRLLISLTVSTANDNILVSPLKVNESVSLTSNGGNIELERIDVGNALSLTVKNGNIKGTVMGSYDMFSIACQIKKGECNLPQEKPEGEKSLKVNCNNGDVKIDFIKD